MESELLFNKFINRIGFYKASVFQIDKNLEDFIKTRKANLPKTDEDFVMPILGSKLVYRNLLTGKNEIPFQRFVDVGNINEKVSEIKEGYSNYCISQSFEAFETLIKDLIAYYLFNNKDFVESIEPQIKYKLNFETFESCRDEIRKLKNNKDSSYNKHFFYWLYKMSPKIEQVERNNFIPFDFQDWNIVMTGVRHSIVHSDSIFDMKKTKGWNDFQLRLLNGYFLKENNDKVIKISTMNNYDKIIERIAQHGQLIADEINTATNIVYSK